MGFLRILWITGDIYNFLMDQMGFLGSYEILWITGNVIDFLMDRMGFLGSYRILRDSVDNW